VSAVWWIQAGETGRAGGRARFIWCARFCIGGRMGGSYVGGRPPAQSRPLAVVNPPDLAQSRPFSPTCWSKFARSRPIPPILAHLSPPDLAHLNPPDLAHPRPLKTPPPDLARSRPNGREWAGGLVGEIGRARNMHCHRSENFNRCLSQWQHALVTSIKKYIRV